MDGCHAKQNLPPGAVTSQHLALSSAHSEQLGSAMRLRMGDNQKEFKCFALNCLIA